MLSAFNNVITKSKWLLMIEHQHLVPLEIFNCEELTLLVEHSKASVSQGIHLCVAKMRVYYIRVHLVQVLARLMVLLHRSFWCYLVFNWRNVQWHWTCKLNYWVAAELRISEDSWWGLWRFSAGRLKIFVVLYLDYQLLKELIFCEQLIYALIDIVNQHANHFIPLSLQGIVLVLLNSQNNHLTLAEGLLIVEPV